jgi:hypothetical protein
MINNMLQKENNLEKMHVSFEIAIHQCFETKILTIIYAIMTHLSIPHCDNYLRSNAKVLYSILLMVLLN